MTSQPLPPPRLGARYTLTAPVERYPHFIAPVAATGTIVEAQPDLIGLHLDRYLPGAEAWNNEVVFTLEDDYDHNGQAAAHPSTARALYDHARPLEEPAIPVSAQTPEETDADRFDRDPQEGVRLVPFDAPGPSRPFGVEVYLLGKPLGRACYHPPQPGASGLAGSPYWYALTCGERFVNRVSDPAGIAAGQTAKTGQSTREQAIGLLLAAHTAGLS